MTFWAIFLIIASIASLYLAGDYLWREENRRP